MAGEDETVEGDAGAEREGDEQEGPQHAVDDDHDHVGPRRQRSAPEPL